VAGWDARKFLGLVLIAVILTLALLPASVESQPLPALGLKNGPFVDKIQFKTVVGDDQLVLALLNDEVDLIGDIVDPTFFDGLIDTEDIEVASRIRNGYGFFTINCAKYPFNITAFRRAAAFAFDKYAISEDIWDGFAQPQDSVVPVVSPWTIEGQLPYSYYDANTEFGNQLLDEAGFYDVHGDGFREAPDGSNFSVLVESASSSPIAIEVGETMAEGLQALHINATSVPTEFTEYLSRLNFHGDYDMMFLAWDFYRFDVDWLAYEFWGENADANYTNYPNFNNSNYDAWRGQLLHSVDYAEVLEAALAMQEILVYECPYIVCYENHMLSAYRTDKFEGFMNDALDGVPTWWTGYKVHLKSASGGPFGGTLRWSNSMVISPFNHMIMTGCPYCFRSEKWLYDSLIRRGPDGNDIAWLAESYSIQTHDDNAAVPENHTRFTFNILRNVTWSDGDSLTAEDVAFTLNYYRDANGCALGVDLIDMTSAYAPLEFVVVVEFAGESYWHLHTVGYMPIIPMHVFTEIGPDNWNLWNPIRITSSDQIEAQEASQLKQLLRVTAHRLLLHLVRLIHLVRWTSLDVS
jgi:peptide/nickel transport system substrate-binding protein